MRFYLDIEDTEIIDFIARIYPWKSIDERDDFLDEKITSDEILQKEYGINFKAYKKILCDTIRFTHPIHLKNGRYRYAFMCDTVPVCMSEETISRLILDGMEDDDYHCMQGIFPSNKKED
jgi:hypothetical protein